ncbi:MAG: type II toxin-antitoxin system RelE/ParE family toxin [Candidatus Marinimicrobia bacterium]|nr:type II toxin-antitoxin system RelE/ParE family toxin [Candidatus Neomarinimicrobiota bacterium]
MIISFKQKQLEKYFHTGRSKWVKPELKKATFRKMDILNAATSLQDLKSQPSNMLHQLKGDRKGQWTIAVNGPWRLCFIYKDGNVFNLELEQYH